ncbi:alpha/beta hydrolase [Flavobacterium branchiophilum]|uniref:alpha/beta hydrolase n=1 Tax=Flavobacterium branchiophilum TaxID=55197 RepID=UPI001CC11B3F|nr:alpha/beta hydrolase [Flavobacterium branchiophilum]
MKLKTISRKIFIKVIGQSLNLLSIVQPKKAALIAYQLFSRPRKGKFNSNKLPKTLQSCQLEQFLSDGEIFHAYIWKGNADIIMLVHGWESNPARWKKMLPFLKKTGKTIVAIEAPAHGMSSGNEFNVPKYTRFLEVCTQKYNPTILIGHSIGGATCIHYQHLNQNPSIKKMVLLGAPSDLQTLIDHYCTMMGYQNVLKKHLQNHFLTKIKTSIDDFSMAKFSQNINTLTLIIHDEDDAIVHVNEAYKIVKGHPKATFIKTKNLGHGLHDEDLYQKMEAFILN